MPAQSFTLIFMRPGKLYKGLSEKTAGRIRRLSDYLKRQLAPNIILHSECERAKETAKELSKNLGGVPTCESGIYTDFGFDLKEMTCTIQEQMNHKNKCILIISHKSDLEQIEEKYSIPLEKENCDINIFTAGIASDFALKKAVFKESITAMDLELNEAISFQAKPVGMKPILQKKLVRS